MKKFIHTYINPNEKRLNYNIINKEYDNDLVDYIIDCCRSLEKISQVKFIGYEHITDESEIDTSEYISARQRTKSKKTQGLRYMHLNDSRCSELRLKFNITAEDDSTKERPVVSKNIVKKLLIPIIDENGYCYIKGTQYFLMSQIVDNSTYTTKNDLVTKSMVPVILTIGEASYTSTDNVEYTAYIYTINLFKKDMSIMLFYLAKIGIVNTLHYFSLEDILDFSAEVRDEEKFVYFSISSKLYIEVNRYFFEKYPYVRTITFMLLEITTNRLTFEKLYNNNYWIEVIGSARTIDKLHQFTKGYTTLTFFDRIIDDTTKKILKTHDIQKKNIYSVLRWMIQNLNELVKKNNLSLDDKRIRCNEYIASLLTKAFNDRTNRVIKLADKATLKNIRDIFSFPGDLLIQKLHRSGLLRYDDQVNDMTFFSKLKVTFKGPQSLGGTNDKNVAAKYRNIDPSYIGRLDINVCGTSDPGTSAILTPFCKLYGSYFNDTREPETFKYEFDKDIRDYFTDDEDKYYIGPSFDTVDEYYDAINNMSEVIDECEEYEYSDGKYVIDINLYEEI